MSEPTIPAADPFETAPAFSLRTREHRIAADGDWSAAEETAVMAEVRRAGSLAVGTIPFEPDRPARLMVPERWERVPAGTAASGGTEDSTAATGPADLARPAAVHGWDSPAYRASVSAGLDLIGRGRLEKIVLSRLLDLEYDPEDPLDVGAVHRALLAQHPDAYVFAVRDGDHWCLGASPELVVSVREGVVTTHPLAGSAARTAPAGGADDVQAGEALLRSAKDRAEHATVVEDIAERLQPLCTDLEVPATPSLLATPQLWHLGTRITGRLREGFTALDAARAVHPTPAICGTPRQSALEAILDLEPHRRGWFGGLVGWTDARGDGEWALNLRSGLVAPERAVLFAGAGIVRGSTPEGEHAETATKLSTMLAALGLSPADLDAADGAAPAR